jgi:myo-inositol 2-dehydrogenase / D-chiro-inositol 1-dehydrogenase
MGGGEVVSRITRFGILSFAHYHANFWAQAVNSSPGAELAGVWDDDSRRGAEAAEKYGTRYYKNLSDLLAVCDAAGITSETSKHPELVEETAKAGVHILLEKPMGVDLEACSHIYHAVRSSGIIFMQNFPKRYDPINHELVSIVKEGRLGRISLVRIRHANYHLLDLVEKADQMWYTNPDLSGGGALIDEGIHAADFLLWLLGEPLMVFSMSSNQTLGLPIEDTAVALFSYETGTLAEIVTSNSLVAAQESVEVYGSKGSAILSGVDLASRDFSDPPYLKSFQHGNHRGNWLGSDVTPNFQKPDFHHQGPLHFLECLRGIKKPVVSVEEGWKSVAMVSAAYKSAQTGQSQKLDFSGFLNEK